MKVDGNWDVDAVITTRELARMIKRSGIMFDRLPDEDWDQDIMGDYTGAAVIFGVTGGVSCPQNRLLQAYRQGVGSH